MTEDLVRRRVVVHGRVQGVWFRDSCRRIAAKEGVGGWARNRRDGTVEVLIEGPAEAVARVVDWCRVGPSSAQVSGIEISEEEPDPAEPLRGFEIT
jgi:acylphosphatase